MEKYEAARFRGSGAVTLWPCLWKRYAWAKVVRSKVFGLENGSAFFGSQVDTMVDNLWKCLSNYGQAIETRGDGRAVKLVTLLLFTDFQPGLSGRCNNWAEGSHQNLGSGIKMGFVPDGGFPVWTRFLFADRTNSHNMFCVESFEILKKDEQGETRNVWLEKHSVLSSQHQSLAFPNLTFPMRVLSHDWC